MDEKNENKIITIDHNYDWTLDEFKMIQPTYERLSINSAR